MNNNNVEMSEDAAKARREYRRNYYAKNKEKCRGYITRYWNKVAAKMKEESKADAE